MRNKFDEQLAQLHRSLTDMAALVERSIADTKKALLDEDTQVASEIIKGDSSIDEMEKEIESICLKLLLNQQPVAKDLRLISTALKIITDMERIGDQAADISEICLILSKEKHLHKPEHLEAMAEETSKMLTRAIDAFVTEDLKLAQSVISSDDTIDALYIKTRSELISLIHEDIENGEQAFDFLQIAKYYERIGDHAVNIAEWVVFSITGKHKDTQVL